MRNTFIIAGGGTGGHIYPGIAIARAIKKINPDAHVQFVGAKGGLEQRIVPQEGFPLDTVSVGRLHKSVSVSTRVMTLLKMPLALFQCLRLLSKYKPTAVLGVGGFASGPMLLVASLLGYRTYIWEPNAMPGMANRWLSRFVTECLIVFDEAQKYLSSKKIRHVGIPVRFTLDAKTSTSPRLKVLIFGGSQGARAINECVFQIVQMAPPAIVNGVEIVHQTGPLDYEQSRDVYKSAPPNFQCADYFFDMKDRYEWCDLVVSRSGASTVAEVIACKKAAVFIPLPTAADDHQRKNAEVLIRQNAAEMILQADLTPQKLIDVLKSFIDHREKIAKFSLAVQSFKFAKADEEIAKILIGGTK